MCLQMYILLFCAIFIICANGSELENKVTVKQGTIIGKTMTSREGKQFSAFLSIPYAEPPIGDLRFRAPVPAKPWNRDLDGTALHPICPQLNVFLQDTEVTGDENCLFLNVYTPNVGQSGDNLYPVMIFIHGGGYFCGTGHLYEADYLIDEDVVLVTLNYRLGVLGFFSTGDEVVPGNNGLKDQALAIKWVYENIRAFGGDPEKITVFGESAGGASAHFHTFSPLSQSYIKRVISQSGTVFNNWALMEKETVVKYSKQVGENFGCGTDDYKEMVECLRSVDANKLVKLQESFSKWDIEPIIIFAPVVEVNTKDAFLTEHPSKILRSGKYPSIPWMTGVNSEEGCVRAAGIYKDQKLIDDLDQDFSKIMALTFSNENPKFEKIAKRIRQFYFGNRKIDNTTLHNAINLYSDIMFVPATDTAVKLHFKYSKQPVYYYLFSHKTEHSFGEIIGMPNLNYGTCHADELLLQFPLNILFKDPLDNLDTYYSKLFIKLWSNFAKTGNPTPERNNVISTLWKPVRTKNLEYYHIGGGVHTASNLYPERIKFWRELNKSEKINIRDEL